MTQQLWATWRLKYIESADKVEGCIFCDFPALPPEHDRENYILYRGEHAFLILNAYPYSNGHLMVVPYRHTASLDEYTDAELLEIMALNRVAVRMLTAAFAPHGFNLGTNMGRVAGAGIAEHLHWHIVPRWNGDTNFMTVLGETRVIPESLTNVYDRLYAQLAAALSVA
jgi:ATP adenylyltransferase